MNEIVEEEANLSNPKNIIQNRTNSHFFKKFDIFFEKWRRKIEKLENNNVLLLKNDEEDYDIFLPELLENDKRPVPEPTVST